MTNSIDKVVNRTSDSISLLRQGPRKALLVTLWGLALALVKLNGTPIASTLWAEDGGVFIEQAHRLGVASIWLPYAGYVIAYSRLVAYISTLFSIAWTPALFLGAWFLAFAVFMYVIARKLLLAGSSPIAVCLLVLLIVAQPNSGEIYFNLTNSQWFLGAALTIHLLIPGDDKPGALTLLFCLLAALTGPFAVLLALPALLQIFFYKDFRRRKWTYFSILIGCGVQGAAIVLSKRASASAMHHSWQDWFQAVYHFFSFGSGTSEPYTLAIAGAFWLAIACIVGYSVIKRSSLKKSTIILIALLLLTAAMYYGSSMIAVERGPQILNPLYGGERYFFIPYTLLIIAAWLLTAELVQLRYLWCSLLLLIEILSFKVIRKDELQFDSYLQFSRVRKEVRIPINPASGPWFINGYNFDPSYTGYVMQDLNINKERVEQGAGIFLNIEGKPADRKTMGLELAMRRETYGLMQVFWSSNDSFSTRQSMTKFYSEKDTVAFFAFPGGNVHRIKVVNLESRKPIDITSVKVYAIN